MLVSKKVEWDMGHRVTNHRSKCSNLHGHRYVAEIYMKGDLVDIDGVSEQGMVIDFGDIKKIARKHVHDVLDHAFMAWEEDEMLMEFFKRNPNQKHIVVPFVPTAENIAGWVFKELDVRFDDKYGTGLRLEKVVLWETPNSRAICKREDIK